MPPKLKPPIHCKQTSQTVLELFFTQVSEGMKALGASVYLLTVAVGTYMASALNLIVARIFHNDPWVAGEARGGAASYAGARWRCPPCRRWPLALPSGP